MPTPPAPLSPARRRAAAVIASLALALTACTPADAEQDSSGSSNSALEFRAPLVGAGEFDSGAVETPLVLWFWAPT